MKLSIFLPAVTKPRQLASIMPAVIFTKPQNQFPFVKNAANFKQLKKITTT